MEDRKRPVTQEYATPGTSETQTYEGAFSCFPQKL